MARNPISGFPNNQEMFQRRDSSGPGNQPKLQSPWMGSGPSNQNLFNQNYEEQNKIAICHGAA